MKAKDIDDLLNNGQKLICRDYPFGVRFFVSKVEEYRLRWHKNKVYQIMGEYKAMIGAIDDH